MKNNSFSPAVFILDCLNHYEQRSFITAVLFLIYLVTLVGNVLVILAISLDHQLQTPMYFYIIILAFIDLTCSTNIIPRMLCAILYDRVVPNAACFTQLYTVHHLEVMQTFLLTFMAYDRYVAIAYPLRYASIITNKMVAASFILSNVMGFIVVIPFLVLVSDLEFCRTNVVPFCMCDYVTMVRIACVDYINYIIPSSIVCAVLLLCPLATILFSYSMIVQAVMKISKEGRKKAFSTCLTHLMVVGIFYVPLFIAYVLPSTGKTAEEYNIIVIIPCIIPPMFNPIIYSLRNKEMKNSILKLLFRRRIIPESTKHQN
ncbi:olfactory receptor 8H1-like [Erpetoichthys calabaricus]|uniref:olfactory receptor 8H1-like n=1 Tax=Erpetoichthys calabaricus TaxID=27687 RepID=UPI0022348247|nr:olfactory receptor 8H1-like [Erpetoichthys calabaricus]